MVNYTLDSSSNIVPVSLTDERKGGCEADFSHLLFYKLNQKHWLVIDTFNDVVEIVEIRLSLMSLIVLIQLISIGTIIASDVLKIKKS